VSRAAGSAEPGAARAQGEDDEEDEEDQEGQARPEGPEALMVQVRENWSHVTGRVERWTPPKDAEDYGELVLKIERVEQVTTTTRGRAFPNMLEKAEGTTIRVRVPPSAATKLDASPGATVSVDVRRGKDPAVVFAHPEKIRVRAR
jgi:hypothetical protein